MFFIQLFFRKYKVQKYGFIILYFLLFFGCNRAINPPTVNTCVAPKREFRAAWLATVANIDWPSNKSLSTEQQKTEFIKLMNFHQKLGLNAVLVQVRTAADAFYAKGSEPWSEWLTGEQGKAPEPFYDPMEFMIKESHSRGLEFHAWLNLNRAKHKSAKSIATNHLMNTKPAWFINYDGYVLFNLGIPEVRKYTVGIVANIVKNYDVDGIHFDDYFYPYTVEGEIFDDVETFKKYGRGIANIEDWRRENVDLLIREIADVIRREKKWVKFGISPFGVWRNQYKDTEGSPTYAGQTSYDNLYADTRKWYREGWIDYIAPQIYFSRDFKAVPYQALANWWAVQPSNRHLYIGQAPYKVNTDTKSKNWADMNELPSQICYNRGNKNIQGSIFFSSKSLINNQLGVTDNIRSVLYKQKAFPPTMAWKDNILPNPPENIKAINTDNGIKLIWNLPKRAKDGEIASYFAIYRFDKKEEPNIENTSKIIQVCYDACTTWIDPNVEKGEKYIYLITTFDRLHNESEPVILTKKFR
jgi:uncharacterized lipoprotein YddW (UPF0748 family)